jgi:D-glycero-D-manno-heptose 1,7-bisphosphate phosphatase
MGEYRRESFDRKPNPGMILRAKMDLGLELADSVLVGDKDSDIEAGRAARVGFNVKLLHGVEQSRNPERLEFSSLYAVGDWLERTFD